MYIDTKENQRMTRIYKTNKIHVSVCPSASIPLRSSVSGSLNGGVPLVRSTLVLSYICIWDSKRSNTRLCQVVKWQIILYLFSSSFVSLFFVSSVNIFHFLFPNSQCEVPVQKEPFHLFPVCGVYLWVSLSSIEYRPFKDRR